MKNLRNFFEGLRHKSLPWKPHVMCEYVYALGWE